MDSEYHPQLATLVTEPPQDDTWLHEIKFDGYRIGCRILNGRATLISRNGKDWTHVFPEMGEAAARLSVGDALIDGEVAVVLPDGRTSFQRLQHVVAGRAVVAHDSDFTQVSPRSAGDARVLSAGAASAPAVPNVVPPAVAPLDKRGTRRAQRVRIIDGVDVQIDGRTAALIDLSPLGGAQVVSPTILKPNQCIRFTLVEANQQTRCGITIAWAAFEIPKGTTRYRAGVSFFSADEKSVLRFIEANKK